MSSPSSYQEGKGVFVGSVKCSEDSLEKNIVVIQISLEFLFIVLKKQLKITFLNIEIIFVYLSKCKCILLYNKSGLTT